MNERIRELAEQARKYARDYVAECKHYGHYMEHNEYELRFEEKFAELIVRECCQLIDDSTPVYSPENLQEDYCKGKLDGYHAALLEIKKHFGVEE